jgi:ribosomal protein L40E
MSMMGGSVSVLVLLLVVAAVVLLVITAIQSRRHTRMTNSKLCPGCGTTHPGFAEYCRTCGRKLA